MATLFHFEHLVSFSPEVSEEVLRQIPALPGVFALRGEPAGSEPYLTRAADLRRRITRLVGPPEPSADGGPVESKRLNLRDRVRTIEYTVTGSEFASLLLLYDASSAAFGLEQARKRLRLFPPYFLRLTLEHQHPRVYSTNRISQRGIAHTYGPFQSRFAAERYCDSVLDLFKLRRCYENLQVHPDHPGCAYGEMKKCMAPCNTSCTAEQYAAEARAVEAFFATQGESMLADIASARDHASAEMDFEQAAALHVQYDKVKAVAAQASELIRPLPQLRAVIVQPAARQPVARQPVARQLGARQPVARQPVARQLGALQPGALQPDALQPDAPETLETQESQEAALFFVHAGCITGPEPLSTLGVRAVKEQTSVGSSLFAQPLMLQAVPLEGESPTPAESPELRAQQAIQNLEARSSTASDPAALADHLSLLRRWFYRPEKQRKGEIFFPNSDGSFPVRRILRGAARMVLGDPAPMADIQRDQVEAAKVKILHEGRPDVGRVVPVVRKKRSAKNPSDAQTTEK